MEEYLVRGAMLACQYGSHPRRLNLPQCHGVYMMEKPVVREDDCVVEKNIKFFGICQCGTPPEGAENVKLVAYGKDEESKENVEGPKCAPDIVGKWRAVKESTEISGKEKAVTMNSYLVCRCGGLIQPISSGQDYEEE